MNDQPIGIFDSGVGGISVLRDLAQKWPGENFYYLGDTARLPYGAKSEALIEQFLIQNIKHLLKVGVKAIVVACNSASTILMKTKIPCPVPLLDVIRPNAKWAVEATRTRHIGVVGTRATVASQAYSAAIHALDDGMDIYQTACPLLVPLAEEGWVDDPLTNMVVFRYVSPMLSQPIDTLILGCTHYPLLKAPFSKVVGQGVKLIEPSPGIIAELEARVELRKASQGGKIDIACTDLTPHLQKLFANLLSPIVPNSVSLVDLN